MVWQGKGGEAPSNPPSGVSSGRRPFDVRIDHEARIVTIQGIRYSFDLFDNLGFAPTGTAVVIGERADGAVTVFEMSRRIGD